MQMHAETQEGKLSNIHNDLKFLSIWYFRRALLFILSR